MLILHRYLLFFARGFSRRNMNARARVYLVVLYTVIAIQLKRAYTTFDRGDRSVTIIVWSIDRVTKWRDRLFFSFFFSPLSSYSERDERASRKGINWSSKRINNKLDRRCRIPDEVVKHAVHNITVVFRYSRLSSVSVHSGTGRSSFESSFVSIDSSSFFIVAKRAPNEMITPIRLHHWKTASMAFTK